MDLQIAGKTALVTAASKGLGLGTARAIVAEGCRVAINARSVDRLAALADDLGTDVLTLPGDVTDP